MVHRDLKPANVKIRPDSHVKVLDFGLAKPLAAEGADQSELPDTVACTWNHFWNNRGHVAGAGEREGGRPNLDIWAFGCVL